MHTRAAAAVLTLAMGAAVLATAWMLGAPQKRAAATPAAAPMPAAQPRQPAPDLFSIPTKPSPARIFYQTAAGAPIPSGSRKELQSMVSMMAALMDRMDEFDANGDGLLDDLEKMAMGMRLRKELTEQFDLNADGKLSADEWDAFHQAMFEKTAQGQRLMARFDLNADGVLDESEQAAYDAHLQQQEQQRQAEERARMDTNGDGQVSGNERRAARRQEREFWRSQMAAAENNFDHDGDGELNIEETHDAWAAWSEYQRLDDFVNRYDRDGDRGMGPADYDAFLTDYDRRSDRADVNYDGKIDVADINAFRDLVLRSRSIS